MTGKLTREKLSKDTILDGAMKLARREGVNFTMRALGKELNAWQNVAYDHFPTKLELQHELLNLIVGEALTEPTIQRFQSRTNDWGERLKRFSIDLFDCLSKYRGVGHLITHHGAAGPPNVVKLVELCLDHSAEKNFSADRSSQIFTVLTFFVAEMADLAAATRDGLVTERFVGDSQRNDDLDPRFSEFMRTSLSTPVRDRVIIGLDIFIAGLIDEASADHPSDNGADLDR